MDPIGVSRTPNFETFIMKLEFFVHGLGESAFPRLLQQSLNSSLILFQQLVAVELQFQFDAILHETMCQWKAINLRGIKFFHEYGCSTPVTTCGWAGKENNFDKLGGTVLGDVLESIDKPFKIPQLPSTEILLVWRFMTGIYFPFHNSRKKIVFVADRAALAYCFGWQLQAGTYSSGVTVERRHSWRDGLYVSESSKRYWDVGTNYERWKKIQKIIKNPSKESQKS